MSAKAECTWGEGPDVLMTVSLKNAWVALDPPDAGSFGLTGAEARRLAAELLVSAERVEEYERSYAEYCKGHSTS